MSSLMFGGRSNRGGGNLPKNAVEFRAGKMTLKGSMVHPDKRKGMVYIYASDDGLTHFCWKDRTSGVVEDDLIIFPEDAVFSKVTQCKDDSRVFLLKFKASSRKLFYWMQEPKTEGDEDVVWKVNEAINNPGGPSSGRGGQTGSSTPTPSEQEMQTLLQSMSQSQLMQLIGGMNDLGGASGLLAQMGLGQLGSGGTGSSGSSGESKPSSTTTAPSTGNSSSAATASKPKTEELSVSKSSASASKPPVQLQDLQKILSGMQSPPSSSVDLAAGVNSEFVKRITSCPSTVSKLAPLLPKFGFTGPSEVKDSDEKHVVDTLISPAFQHALSSFCSAFPTGQLGPLVEQFEFGTVAVQAARSGNLEAFLNAIQNETDSKTQEPIEKPEDMNVD